MIQRSESLASLFSFILLSGILILLWVFPIQPIPLMETKSHQQEVLMLAVLAGIQSPPTPNPERLIEPPSPPLPEQLDSSPESIMAEAIVATTAIFPEVALAEPIQSVSMPKTIKPVKKVTPKVVPKIKPVPSEKEVIANTPTLTPVVETIPSPVPVQTPQIINKPQQSTSDIMAKYRTIILDLLAKHKHYPTLSRRLYEEGKTVLSFTVHRSGQVSDLQLLTGSGFERLDLAALEIFETLKMQLPAFFPEMPEDSLSFQLPIVYALY